MSGPGLTKRAAYARGTAAGVAGRSVETVCAIAQLWLLTRILPEASFGRFVFAMAVVQIMAVIGSAGFERLTIFRLSRSDAAPGLLAGGGFAGAVMGWAIMLSLVLAGVTWLAAPAVGVVTGDPGVSSWLRGLVWLAPVIVAAETYKAWHLARQRVEQAILAGRALPAVLVTAGLAVTWGSGLGAAGVIGSFVGGRGAALLGWWIARPVNPLRFRGKLDRADAVYAAQIGAAALVNQSIRQSDLLMLLPMAGPAVTAYYAVVQRFAWLLRSGHELLSPIFASRAGHLLHRGARVELGAEFNANRAWTAMIALGLSVPLILFGREVLRHFVDAPEAYPVLLILLAHQVAFALLGMTGVILMMTGRGGWSLGSNLMMLAGNVGLNLLLIPLLGAAGAALALLASVLIVKSLNALVVWKLEGIATVSGGLALLLAQVVGTLLLGAFDLLTPIAVSAVCAVVLAVLAIEQAASAGRRATSPVAEAR